ncbi:MAG: hypothetical protein EBX41_05095, partial [Chitinophagia bacterium]|nr:hypothetical protein [Chitinophagia bacterium]
SLEIVKGIIEGQAINYKVQNVTSNTRVESGCFSIEFRNTGRYNCMIDEKVLKPNEVWKLEAFNERLKIGNNFNIIFEDEQTIDLTKTSSKI